MVRWAKTRLAKIANASYDAGMSTLNISLPPDLREVVDRQVKSGAYASHSEYIRSLIREDQKRIAWQELEAKLLKRLDSPSKEMTAAEWRKLREQFLQRVSKRRAG